MASRGVRIITKQTSVSGRIPTGTTGNEASFIKQGELAQNTSDKKLFGFDGTNVYEFGSDSFLSITGGTIYGDLIVNSLTATTYFSGSTPLETIIYNISSNSSQQVFIQPGINTFTGGTVNFPTINVTGLTIDNIFVSGSSIFSSLSATSISGTNIYSGSTNIGDLFSPIYSSPFRSYILTAGTEFSFSGNINTLSIDKATGSATHVNLPGSPNTNSFFVVKDKKGDSKTNPITVSGGTYTIDGYSSYVISIKDYPSLTFLFDGQSYIVI